MSMFIDAIFSKADVLMFIVERRLHSSSNGEFNVDRSWCACVLVTSRLACKHNTRAMQHALQWSAYIAYISITYIGLHRPTLIFEYPCLLLGLVGLLHLYIISIYYISMVQCRAYFKENVQLHTMASAVARAYNGVSGLRPPVGSRGFAPSGGSGVFAPLKLTKFCVNKSKICH